MNCACVGIGVKCDAEFSAAIGIAPNSCVGPQHITTVKGKVASAVGSKNIIGVLTDTSSPVVTANDQGGTVPIVAIASTPIENEISNTRCGIAVVCAVFLANKDFDLALGAV